MSLIYYIFSMINKMCVLYHIPYFIYPFLFR
uniref:Uncharacterized protein n=1 Tax=Geladintestivirus 1 TaxID=3233133 RepID=A0AAU8MI88_9CAUD